MLPKSASYEQGGNLSFMALNDRRYTIIHDKDGDDVAVLGEHPTGDENGIVVRPIDPAWDPVEGVLKTAGLVWDVDTLSWVRAQQPNISLTGDIVIGGDTSTVGTPLGALPQALVVEPLGMLAKGTTFTYNVDGDIETITTVIAGGSKKRVDTFTYSSGNLQNIDTTIVDV